MRFVCPRVLLGLTLALGSCSSSEDGGNGNQAGSGGSGGSSAGSGGGRAGSGGSSAGSGGSTAGSGGSGGSAAGSGGAAGGAGGAMGGAGGAMGGSGGAMGGAGGAMGDAGSVDGGPGDMAPAQGMVKCGDMRPNLNGYNGSSEGIVIAPDGTIYFSQSFSGTNIGRVRPGMPLEANWVNVGQRVLGITYDPKRKVLYAGSRGRSQILSIDVTAATPMAVEFAEASANVNGVTLGEDGAVYWADQGNGHIYKADPNMPQAMRKFQVTTSPVNNANGLAFGPDGKIYVAPFRSPAVISVITLGPDGKGAPETFVTLSGSGNADGIAFDAEGNIHVTAGGLWKISPQKQFERVMPDGAVNGANLDFGAGVLSCNDLYSGGNNGGIRIAKMPVVGANVPWHREAP